MLLTKSYIVCLIVLIQIVSVFIDSTYDNFEPYNGVPYFPIEISRTAASRPYANFIFALGTTCLIIPMYFDNMLETASYIIMYFGLLFVAIYDDVTAWVPHMCGVVMIIMGFVLNYIREYSNTNKSKNDYNFRILVIAHILFIFRVLMKVMVILKIELGLPLFRYNTWLSFLIDSLYRDNVFTIAMDIMYNGKKYNTYNDTTIMVFKLAGILQWVFFWLLSLTVSTTDVLISEKEKKKEEEECNTDEFVH